MKQKYQSHKNRVKNSEHNPGGMNPDAGFPMFFTDISETLGRYSHYSSAANGIASYFPPKDFHKVLDICCGPGHFCNALSERGYNTLGIDISKDQIAEAQSQYPDIEFNISDMANLQFSNIELITNVYTSFGYLKTAQEDFSLLSHWNNCLKKGGGIVIELADMEKARNKLPSSGKLKRCTNDVVEYLSLDWSTNILEVKYQKTENSSWSCYTRLFEREELVEQLCIAGFKNIRCFGDFEGKNKEPDDNLIIFAEKK